MWVVLVSPQFSWAWFTNKLTNSLQKLYVTWLHPNGGSNTRGERQEREGGGKVQSISAVRHRVDTCTIQGDHLRSRAHPNCRTAARVRQTWNIPPPGFSSMGPCKPVAGTKHTHARVLYFHGLRSASGREQASAPQLHGSSNRNRLIEIAISKINSKPSETHG